MEVLQQIRTILELGWPAIVLIQLFIVWRDNISLRNQLVEALKGPQRTEISNGHAQIEGEKITVLTP